MKIIGITGGVGAGKSTILDYLSQKYDAYVIQADKIGHLVMEPGGLCYEHVIALFGRQIIKNDKTIDRKQVSAILEEEMKGAAKLSVELEVDMHQGNNWYEAK